MAASKIKRPLEGNHRFTPESEEEYIALRAQGQGHYQAVRNLTSCVVTPETVSTHYKQDPEFRRRVDEAKDANIDEVEHALYREAKAGRVAAAKFLLTNRRPHDWQERSTQDVVLRALTDQEIIDMLVGATADNPQGIIDVPPSIETKLIAAPASLAAEEAAETSNDNT
jgi:vancomycin resistance protein YoaR